MRRTWWASALPVALALLLLACGQATPPPQPAPVHAASSPPSAPVHAASPPQPAGDPVAQRADAIVARARAIEPAVTPLLVSLAEQHGGEMVKLEFRLKTKESTARKLKQRMHDKGVALEDVVIDDSLRYTMRVDDQPPGRHIEAVKATLAALEQHGHSVVRLKNYWPVGDNYSGINGVLRTKDGMLWELQFHTSQSMVIQKKTRAWYEELRRVDTPVARKRELFDLMTKAWNEADIPLHMLEPGELHPMSQIIDRPRP